MAAREQKVGRLTVKWDDDQPFGAPFVTVTRPGLVPVCIKEFSGRQGEADEPYVQEAKTWAEQNQDQANDGVGGLFSGLG